MKMQIALVLFWILGLVTDVSGVPCQRCCPNCVTGTVYYCCPFGYTCNATYNGECVPAEFTDDEEGELCNRVCDGTKDLGMRCNDGPKTWCRYGYTCSTDDDTGICKPIVQSTSTMPPTSTSTPVLTTSMTPRTTSTAIMPTQSTSTTTQPGSTTTTTLHASTSVSDSCTKCSATGILPPAPPNCCPFSKTCDQPGGGTCISAEPSDEGGNNPPCLRVRANGDKIWCHFGTTCSTPDGTGVCKPLQGTTTVETTIGETSDPTTQPTSTTTETTSPTTTTLQASTSVSNSCTKCSTSGFLPPAPPDCCPFSQTCDQPGGGTCMSAEPSDEGGNNPPCLRIRTNGDKIWCHFGTTCSTPDGTGVCKPLQGTTTVETTIGETSDPTTQPTSTTTETTSPTTTTLQASTSVSNSCTKCSTTGILPPAPPDCCPFSQACDQPGGGTCISAEPSDEGGNNPPCLRVRANGDKIWCHFGTTCSTPDGTGVCKPLQGTTTVEPTTDETSSTTIAQSTSTTTTTQPTSTTTTTQPISTTTTTQPISTTTSTQPISTTTTTQPTSTTTTTQPTSTTTTTQPTSTTTTTQPTSTTTTTPPTSTTTTTQPTSTTTTTQPTSTTTTTQPTSTITTTQPSSTTITTQTTSTMPPTSTTVYTSTLQPCRRCCPHCTNSPSYCCPYGETCTSSNNGVCVPYPVEQNENEEEFECSRVCNACTGPKIWCKVGYTCSSGNGAGRCKQV